MNNPEYIKIGDKKYKINTDYRTILKINKISCDNTIKDYERIVAIMYLFYGEDMMNNPDFEKLVYAMYDFMKGRPSSMKPIGDEKQEIDMDYDYDMGLIIASMKSEYGIDITKEKIHWWSFFDYLNGLSTDCILNRVREIRSKDLSKIKDKEERDEYERLQKIWSLDKKKTMTAEQKKSVEEFYKDFTL